MTEADEPASPEATDHNHVQQATAEAAATATEAVSATAEAMNQATSEAASLNDAVAERYAAASSETAAAFEQARSRMEQAGMPGIAASQGIVDQFKAGSELLSRSVMQDYGQSQKAMVEFNAKVVEAWRKNAESTIAYWQRLSGVTNWSDLVAINTAHLRQQIEVMTAQTRELADLAGKTARDSAESLTKIGRPG